MIIENERDHAKAIERLDALMDLDPAVGSIKDDEINELAMLIEQYEMMNFPLEEV